MGEIFSIDRDESWNLRYFVDDTVGKVALEINFEGKYFESIKVCFLLIELNFLIVKSFQKRAF